MSKHLIVFLVLVVLIFPLKAQSSDVYLEYLKPLLEHETESASDVWENTGSGGYLFRFKLDIDGNGSNKLFVASSLWINNLDAQWAVFSENRSGKNTAYKGTIKVPITQIVLEETAEGTSLLSWSQDRGKYFVTSYTFNGNQIVKTNKEVPSSTIRAFEAGQNVKKIIPKLEAIHIADYLRDPAKKWMTVDPSALEGNAMGYIVIPQDVERIKDINLTPQMALKEVRQLMGEDKKSGTKTEIRNPHPVSQALPSDPSLVVASTTVEKPNPSSFPIIPVVILAALIAGAAVFFLRRKKP